MAYVAYSITVLGRPCSDNRKVRTFTRKNGKAGVYLSNEATSWRKAIEEAARKECPEPMVCSCSVYVHYYHEHEKQYQDATACLKIVCDALQGIAYVNDKQIQYCSVGRWRDKDNPRVTIEVVSCE